MAATFDLRKDHANREKYRFSLSAFELMDITKAWFQRDTRKEYTEARYNVFAPVEGRLCVATIVFRGSDIRVISFRKCNRREVECYEES